MPNTGNTLPPLVSLKQQYAGLATQAESLSSQIKAAVRREADLRQQLNDSQAELAKLGLMQLGKKMMVKAEQDSLRKKLTANQQLQESLLAKQQACHEQQAALQQQIASAEAAEAAPSPLPEPTPIPKELPKQAAAVPAPVQRSPQPSVRRTRAPKLDASLPPQEQVAQLITRLSALYPQRQVFALDTICPDLHSRLTALAPICGCASATELLARQGFTIITGVQGRALHDGLYCVPGEEPEVIRSFLTSVMKRLEKHYPERTILRSIQSEHKSLAQDVCALYQWLGYPSAAAMLTAYGFRHQVTAGGRPATDVHQLLEALRAAAPENGEPRTIAQLMKMHPDLAGALKTLQNQAPARFGMTLKQYLTEQGILAPGTGK